MDDAQRIGFSAGYECGWVHVRTLGYPIRDPQSAIRNQPVTAAASGVMTVRSASRSACNFAWSAVSSGFSGSI